MTCQERPREIAAYYDDLLEADGSFQVEQCSMDLAVDTDNERLTACVQLQVRAAQPLSHLRFNLSGTFDMTTVYGSPAVYGWGSTGNVVTVSLRDALAPGRRVTLTFRYEGPIRVHSHYEQVLCAIGRTGGVLTDWWFPWLRGLRALFFVTLQVPRGRKAVANAPLMRHQGCHYEWQSDRPLSNFEIAIGAYVVRVEQSSSRLTVRCFSYEKDVRYARDLMQATERLLSLWDDRFGPAPWQEVQIVEVPAFYRGGRGPAPMLWLSEQFFTDDMNPRLVRLIGHELAHHWWGELVRGAGPGGLWLQEGIATYSELLCVEAFDGREAYHRAARNLARRFHRRMKGQKQVPLAQLRMDDPLLYYILYSKGALILYRLRESVGDAAFFNVLRGFCQSYSTQRATVEDFQKYAEHASGADLKAFFRGAFYETGLPSRRLITRQAGKDP